MIRRFARFCMIIGKVWVFALSFAAATRPASGQTTSIPYRDTFETYTNAQTIIGTNGWVAGNVAFAVVTNMTYTYNYPCGYPFPGAEHTQVVRLDTEGTGVSNCFSRQSNTNVTIDFMMYCVRSEDEEALKVLTNDNTVQMGFYVNTNGNPVILYSVRWFDLGAWEWRGTNAYYTVSDVTLASGEWTRVTVTMDYLSDNSDRYDTYFQIAFNGTSVTSDYAYAPPLNADPPIATGTWFVCANYLSAVSIWFTNVIFVGTGYLDDYKVEGDAEPLLSITSTIWSDGKPGDTRGGWVLPTIAWVQSGGSTNFTIGANTYWSYTNLVVNGTPQMPTNNLVFENVTSNQAFDAYFGADRTTNGVPHWWLAQQNSNWTNDFEAAANGDPDGDGMTTRDEYLASTDPDDANSVFRILEFVMPDGTNYTLRWLTAAIDPDLTNMPFFVQRTGDLTNPVWEVVGSVSPRVAGTSEYASVSDLVVTQSFFRVVVTNTVP